VKIILESDFNEQKGMVGFPKTSYDQFWGMGALSDKGTVLFKLAFGS
jgi:hypothetical protein